MKALNVGDRVDLFFDPMTCSRFDATVTVRKIISKDSEVHLDGVYYRILAEYDDEPRTTHPRFVMVWKKGAKA